MDLVKTVRGRQRAANRAATRGIPSAIRAPVPAEVLAGAEHDAGARQGGAEILRVTLGEGAGLVGEKDEFGLAALTTSSIVIRG
ncbi:MAG: hypothetical protein HY704_03985 [Gemmatimonadetes bacterium]|nr:hypothetical protein [Gemmatimonadota bacterium]